MWLNTDRTETGAPEVLGRVEDVVAVAIAFELTARVHCMCLLAASSDGVARVVVVRRRRRNPRNPQTASRWSGMSSPLRYLQRFPVMGEGVGRAAPR